MARARSRLSPLHCCTRWEECRALPAPLRAGISSALLSRALDKPEDHQTAARNCGTSKKVADSGKLARFFTALPADRHALPSTDIHTASLRRIAIIYASNAALLTRAFLSKDPHASAATINFLYLASQDKGTGKAEQSCCAMCAATMAPSMMERPQLSPPARILDSI